MKILNAIALTSILGMAGCGMTQPSVKPFVPSGPVAVIVTAQKYLLVDQEPIHVHGQNVELKWNLDAPPGYTFPDDGIVITKAYNSNGIEVPVPAGEFNCRVLGAPRRMFQCIDKNSTQGRGMTYKYNVRVLDPNGPALPLDPWINNH
jgi:hypothetical protein